MPRRARTKHVVVLSCALGLTLLGIAGCGGSGNQPRPTPPPSPRSTPPPSNTPQSVSTNTPQSVPNAVTTWATNGAGSPGPTTSPSPVTTWATNGDSSQVHANYNYNDPNYNDEITPPGNEPDPYGDPGDSNTDNGQ